MELNKLPSPIRIIWGSLAAWWLAHIINPGFFAVAVMLLLMIPVLVTELYLILPDKPSLPPISEQDDDNSAQENSA